MDIINWYNLTADEFEMLDVLMKLLCEPRKCRSFSDCSNLSEHISVTLTLFISSYICVMIEKHW